MKSANLLTMLYRIYSNTHTHTHTLFLCIIILWPLITWSCTAGDIGVAPLWWPAVILLFQSMYNFPPHRHCWQGGVLSTLPAPQLMIPPWPSSKQRRFLHNPLTARKQKRNYKHRLNLTKDLSAPLLVFLHFQIVLGHAFLHHLAINYNSKSLAASQFTHTILHCWWERHHGVRSKTVQQFLDVIFLC